MQPQRLAVAHKRAAGAESADENVYLRQISDDLGSCGLKVRPWIGLIAVLVREVIARVICSNLLGDDDRFVGAFIGVREDDLSPVSNEEVNALLRHTRRHYNLQVVSTCTGYHRQRHASIARCGFYDGVARLEQSVAFGGLNHRLGHAVFDRSGRVRSLKLGVDPHALYWAQNGYVYQRRIADGVHDVPFQHVWDRFNSQGHARIRLLGQVVSEKDIGRPQF